LSVYANDEFALCRKAIGAEWWQNGLVVSKSMLKSMAVFDTVGLL